MHRAQIEMAGDKSVRKWSLMPADVVEQTVETLGRRRGGGGAARYSCESWQQQMRRRRRRRRRQREGGGEIKLEHVTRNSLSHVCE